MADDLIEHIQNVWRYMQERAYDPLPNPYLTLDGATALQLKKYFPTAFKVAVENGSLVIIATRKQAEELMKEEEGATSIDGDAVDS